MVMRAVIRAQMPDRYWTLAVGEDAFSLPELADCVEIVRMYYPEAQGQEREGIMFFWDGSPENGKRPVAVAVARRAGDVSYLAEDPDLPMAKKRCEELGSGDIEQDKLARQDCDCDECRAKGF